MARWIWASIRTERLDPKGYQSEQILSTTHFRIYRAIGGDSAQLNMRRFAARFVAYLILRAVGSLTPAHPPEHAAAYAAALMIADAFDWTSEGQAGGAYAKVIRWAFEKQGLYQAKPVQARGDKRRCAAARRRLHRGRPARRIPVSAQILELSGDLESPRR